MRASAARRELAATQLGEEIRRRDDLRQMFRRYLSPRLADKIIDDGNLRNTLLAGADLRAHAVVLFADLRGFTSIAERLSPDAVVLLLNEYFSLLTNITFRHDGTIFHMAGDCLMVGFGVPMAQADAPERAVLTAREMLEGFGALAQTWKENHDIETGLGIGINEGEVIAGNVGSAAYMNYTIVGDTVNVASRLCQRARAGEMLFSRSFKRSLDESRHRGRCARVAADDLAGASYADRYLLCAAEQAPRDRHALRGLCPRPARSARRRRSPQSPFG